MSLLILEKNQIKTNPVMRDKNISVHHKDIKSKYISTYKEVWNKKPKKNKKEK